MPSPAHGWRGIHPPRLSEPPYPVSTIPQNLPSAQPRLPVVFAPLARPPFRIQPQTLRPSHRLHRNQVPRIHRLHMRRNNINLFLRISFLPAPPSRMYRLHFIPSQIQSPRPFHLHAHHPLFVAPPHYKIPALAVSPGQRHVEPHRRRLQQKCCLRNLPRLFRIPAYPLPPLLSSIRHPAHVRNRDAVRPAFGRISRRQ